MYLFISLSLFLFIQVQQAEQGAIDGEQHARIEEANAGGADVADDLQVSDKLL